MTSEHAKVDNVHTRRMAEFISGLTYEAVPASVRDRIKLLILDSLGCALVWRADALVRNSANDLLARSTRPARLRFGARRSASLRRTLP